MLTKRLIFSMAVNFYDIAFRIASDIEQLKMDSDTKLFRSLYDLNVRNFSKYGDIYDLSNRRKTVRDVKADLKLEGTKHLIIKDQNKAVGEIVGIVDNVKYWKRYALVDGVLIGNWADQGYSIDIYKKCLRQNPDWATFIRHLLQGKVYRIQQLAIDPEYRSSFLSLASQMRDFVRSKGYKYITCDSMKDSQHLLLDESGHLRPVIARRFGLSEYHINTDDPDFLEIILKVN